MVKGSRTIRTPDAPDVSVVDIPVSVVADDMELVVMALTDAASVVAEEDAATELPADLVCWDDAEVGVLCSDTVVGRLSVCVEQSSVNIPTSISILKQCMLYARSAKPTSVSILKQFMLYGRSAQPFVQNSSLIDMRFLVILFL